MRNGKNKMFKKDFEMVMVRHKCGRVWRVTRNALDILWCPDCKTSKGFKKCEQKKC